MLIRNLLDNPKPLAASITNSFSNTQIVDAPGGGITVSTINDYTGPGDDHEIHYGDLPAGQYHFHAEITVGQNTTPPDYMIWCQFLAVPAQQGSGPVDIDVSINGVGMDRFTLKCGLAKGDNVTYRRVGLYTQADWQAMQNLGLNYFDGGTMPLAS